MSLAKVKKLANELGATVIDGTFGNSHECMVEAPHGKVWKCCGIHELVDSTNKPWKPDYKDVLDRMSYGLEDCEDGFACEWCYPVENDLNN